MWVNLTENTTVILMDVVKNFKKFLTETLDVKAPLMWLHEMKGFYWQVIFDYLGSEQHPPSLYFPPPPFTFHPYIFVLSKEDGPRETERVSFRKIARELTHAHRAQAKVILTGQESSLGIQVCYQGRMPPAREKEWRKGKKQYQKTS